MPSLKLVSIYGNPCKLVRSTLAASPPPPASPATIKHPFHRTSSSSRLGLNLFIAGRLRTSKKATPCAPKRLHNSSHKFGFIGCKGLSSPLHVAKSYSSESDSTRVPSSSVVVAERSSEDKDGDLDHDAGINEGKLSSPSEDDQSDDQQQQPSKLLTLPTVLTVARVAAVPVLISTFYMDGWLGTTATTGIFVFASITDWLDGYLARKMKLSSQFGAFLDPVADKLMVATTLILLCTTPLDTFGQAPWLLTVPAIAIIGREITMSAVREWAASQGGKLSEAVAVNNLGKWKTATQMSALTILLATRDSSLVGAGGLVATGVALLYISAWLAVWSLFVYMKKISKVLLK